MTNSTGIYRVHKQPNGNGFIYRYRWTENGKRNTISRTTIEALEEAVKDQGLEWKILDYELAYADVGDDDWVFPLAHPPKPSDYL